MGRSGKGRPTKVERQEEKRREEGDRGGEERRGNGGSVALRAVESPVQLRCSFCADSRDWMGCLIPEAGSLVQKLP